MKLNNFSDFARVVIIDDSQEEGLAIKGALESIQIPSLFYHATSNKSLPQKTIKNIRLVFLDLIFSDSGGRTDPQNAGNAISKLSTVIGKTGFYILVIWSSHTTEGVATTFQAQLERQSDFAKPYKLLTLQKTDFRTPSGKFKIKAIIREINEQLASSPSLRVFADWESLTTNSISDIAGNIVGQKTHQDLSRTINSLSEAYAGKGKPKDIPQNALLAFNEVFKGVVSEGIISNDFGSLYRKIETGKLSDPEKAKLNTYLIFTPDTNIGPGSIFKIKQSQAVKKKFIGAILDQDQTTLGAAYAKIIPIAVEITPLCNAAQKNAKHSYFLNGIIHPEFYPPNGNGNMKKISVNRDKKPHCYMLEKSFWDITQGETFRLSFNLKLFHSSISKQYTSMGKKLRDNFVIDLQHQVAGYISRPGHVLL
ncbi:MAG TPA: hypothetical protein VMF88_10480 [Bacteroidota bacterium]|nr:hypothetical protein [Bacteroidota bacterium]